ncbi:UvrD-helicase domain-containing protein [Streptomyces sp. WMMC500]|uniref:UvrD-helicase domain-containing protein n=1 Tax=Streptomyces sp. WMMC500 TaxID=3015154 RepID=UPI00248BA738|nr:UvrD-helicase domain-containing protein [Streptomyces sp. WMMC500]WBB62558.1 UvrD-helicase domain-containing protein [Streptomyces sp. WMMC500]
MTARLSLYEKAEQELYKLDRSVKGKFYDFSHRFRQNPDHPGLDLKPLKGDGRVYRAKIDQSYRALLAKIGLDAAGREKWLVVAVRHRKHVYEELSVAINRITGEIEFVDLSVVGRSVLQRAGMTLTPADPEGGGEPGTPAPVPVGPEPADQAIAPPEAEPLLAGLGVEDLRDLGVAEQLIEFALAVTESTELDALVSGAPLLTKDILYGLAAGLSIEDVRKEITAPVDVALEESERHDLDAALARTTVTTVDDALKDILEEGDFRAWKVFLHPAQAKLVHRHYSGPFRVSGGPGTGKTIVALHRVNYLAEQLPPGHGKPILLTTFTKNLTTDLRARLSSLLEPELLARVDITHIDQLAARVLNENTAAGAGKQRIYDSVALNNLRQVLLELDEKRWDAEFLYEEWEQVILGQSLGTRKAYFDARRAGRGRSVSRPDRAQIWKILEQFTTRLDKEGRETWGQAAERAARFEMQRAAKIEQRQGYKDETDGKNHIHRDDSSGMHYLSHRYRHVVVDEAQDLRPAHWKMLRAMVAPGEDDMFIAGDTHQRIYGQQVTLGTVGVNIRGRAARLTLSYRTTREILSRAIEVVNPKGGQITFDDLDDGTDNLDGYRSVLRGPAPELVRCVSWDEELARLAVALRSWRAELATGGTDGKVRDPRGNIAVCVADRDAVNQVMLYLAAEGELTVAELTKDGVKGDGDIHVGTMHRFKGLEYQRLAIVGARDGVIPRASVVQRYRETDPRRLAREELKARSLLFVAATRARDTLRISWYGKASPYLPR